jgi:hypothetical protein
MFSKDTGKRTVGHVRVSTVPVEEHGHKLDDNNGEEEEHKDDTDRLQVEVLFRDDDLEINIIN